MKLGRTCAAAALLGISALPLTAAISWADTTPSPRPGASSQPAEQQPKVAAQPDVPKTSAAPAPAKTRQEPAQSRQGARVEKRQVTQRPAGAPDTGGGPAEWNATPVYLVGGAAAVAVAGVGTVLVLRRRQVRQH
ncbi:Tat pathway signal sequence domain protein [Sciscionella sediminilitoris]|uniref:Tat pathway signal sequence domain protein n=1 Tax=Sciscionella sediminilitoris TaxID=1445613 RepID=UPI0012E3127C|nr:Tat pathway signal sequence domain protein [Sciscionella sp. SE31]